MSDCDSKIYLVDTSFFIFRAYHALPPLTTADGLPTGVIHGVASMFERLIRTEKPGYLAAVFDTSRKTFRTEIYPQYKANREEPDEDLKVQFPYVRKLVEAMSIFQLERAGFEADDLLATLARRFAADGREVVIVTGDKDLMQCVGEGVSLFDPVKGVYVGDRQVREKFGVGPRQVADVLGLTGDASDNFPGVRGIGPKTAAALIAHFGTLDAVLERSEEIETLNIRGAKGVRKKIEDGADMARLCRRLATVVDDVDVEAELQDLAVRPADPSAIQALSEQLELRRLPERLGVGTASTRPSGARNGSRSDHARDRAQAELGLAGPAASGSWEKLRGKQLRFLYVDGKGGEFLCLGAGRSRAVVVGHAAIAEALRGVAEREASLSGYDLKTVVRVFSVDAGGGGLDLGVAAYLVDPGVGGYGADDLCRRFLEEERMAVPSTDPEVRAALDQIDRLATALGAELAARGQTRLYRELEHPLVAVLANMEAAGVLIDTAALAEMSKDLEARMQKLVARIYAAAGHEFNILSPLQLRRVLFDELELPTKGIKKTKTGPSTDSESLQALASRHPLPELVLGYRALAKLKSTYIDALPRVVDSDSRIHTTLHQTVTATGRLSSSDPNLQNIPIRSPEGRLIREAFVAPEGCVLVSADYNQIELRVLAHLSDDQALIEAFERGEDIHRKTAREVFGDGEVSAERRRQAKVINFGIIYGMGAGRLSRELGITRSQASEYIERYFDRYPGVRRFYADTLARARVDGFVSTLLGRRRYLPDLDNEHGGRRQLAERVATNTPIQGSAADIIKTAMVDLASALRRQLPEVRMVLQIHDELLLECPKGMEKQALELTRAAMEGAADLRVPIVVDINTGSNWAEAH